MNAGAWAAAAVVVGFIGFELFAVSRNGYRMEPAHILGEFASASRGVDLCAEPEADQVSRFQRNYDYARHRAKMDLSERETQWTDRELDASIRATEADAIATVDALVTARGCTDIDAWKLVKRYENLARLNLRLPKS